MNNKLTHFAIYVDNIKRASTFYKKVFNWGFAEFGQSEQPDFLQITAADNKKEPMGALQHRKYSVTSEKVIGLECSFAVEDVEKVTKTVEDAGGEILMSKTEIPQVGWIIKFKDTEGNILCAVQYHDHILSTINA